MSASSDSGAHICEQHHSTTPGSSSCNLFVLRLQQEDERVAGGRTSANQTSHLQSADQLGVQYLRTLRVRPCPSDDVRSRVTDRVLPQLLGVDHIFGEAIPTERIRTVVLESTVELPDEAQHTLLVAPSEVGTHLPALTTDVDGDLYLQVRRGYQWVSDLSLIHI